MKTSQITLGKGLFIALALSLTCSTLALATTSGGKTGQPSNSIEIPRIHPGDIIIQDPTAGFTLKYNPSTIGADFVAYKLCRDDLKGEITRKNRFFSDPQIIQQGLPYAKNSDYTKSGYDRGHLLPSADRQATQIANDATFNLANCLPQTPALNRGTWKKIEEATRKQTALYDTLYIVTGVIPSTLPNQPSIGANKIKIPQAFFKAILKLKNNHYSAQAYIIPNNAQSDPNPETYLTTIDNIERLTKLDLFHKLEDSIEKRVESM